MKFKGIPFIYDMQSEFSVIQNLLDEKSPLEVFIKFKNLKESSLLLVMIARNLRHALIIR